MFVCMLAARLYLQERMAGNQMLVRCIAILLLFSTVNCQTQNGTQLCLYQYTRQPGRANCHPEAPLPLELRCQVTGSDNNNFKIQWHHSNSSPSSQSISSMQSVVDKAEFDIQEETFSFALFSKIRLDYDEADGYYWCMVTNASHPTSNPSQVVNISTYHFTGDTATTVTNKCITSIGLSEPTLSSRCANDPVSIDIVNVQLGSTEMFETKVPVTTSDIKETTSQVHESDTEPLPTTDISYTSEEIRTTVTERISTSIDFEQSTISSAAQFPMHYIWTIVGIAFVLLIAIIIIMLIAILYLNHKKNKIRVSNLAGSHSTNTYINPDSTKAAQQDIRAEAGYYEISTNTIHAHNTTFSGDHSPNSRISSLGSGLHSPQGEYEEINTTKSILDSVKAAQRHQYEMVESGEQSEYSHLQHAHGGSRKFSTNSTGAYTAHSPSMLQNRGKMSITSSLSLSGHHQPEPVFDSPEYMTIELNGTKTQPETGESVINDDAEYSHINHEALNSRARDTTREADLECPDMDSEGYHQLPSVFIGTAKERPNNEVSPEQRQNNHTTNTHPPACRHKSATTAVSQPYASVESTNVMKRNTYSFTIVSTDEQYVSEQGHLYHLLERSDVHQQNQSTPSSNEGTLKFHIEPDDSAKDKSSVPPYSQVNKSMEQDSNKQEDEESEEQNDSEGSNMQESSHNKVIPLYSQVDKSKKKSRQSQHIQEAHDL